HLSAVFRIDADMDSVSQSSRVLEYEIHSLPANRKIFIRNPNSNVFFLTTRNACKQYIKQIFLSALLLLLSLLSLTSAQRRRNRGKGKGKLSCHLKDVDKCLEPLSSLQKADNPTQILATADGVDRLCGTLKGKFGACVRDYFKKCGTPLHREISGLILDQILFHSNDLCKKGPKRERFLRVSPCVHEKALSTRAVKDECNNRYIATLNAANAQNNSLASVCCAFNFWQSCVERVAQKECGKEGADAVAFIVDTVFMDLPHLTCPAGLFPADSDQCAALVLPRGKKVKLSSGESGVSRYNVAHVFSFMFSN
ncbi:unnamed protein product, partial [Medioppia subpectinata]